MLLSIHCVVAVVVFFFFVDFLLCLLVASHRLNGIEPAAIFFDPEKKLNLIKLYSDGILVF